MDVLLFFLFITVLSNSNFTEQVETLKNVRIEMPGEYDSCGNTSHGGLSWWRKVFLMTAMIMNYIEIKRELFATQALSQTQKNVSEPQTGIEPATSDHRRSENLRVRFPSGAQKHFSVFAIKLE